MNAPYYREYFDNKMSIHAKTMKELNRAIDVFEEVENTINYLNKKEGSKFIISVTRNNKLKIDIVFHGSYLIVRAPDDFYLITEDLLK